MKNKNLNLSPTEAFADEIIEIHLGTKKLTKENREFVRNIISCCLTLAPESERYERFFNYAMNELKRRPSRGSF